MPRKTRTLLPLLALGTFAGMMFAPLLFGGEIYYFRDFGRFYRPVKSLYLDRLASGEFPIWMPEMNFGTAVHGELVHAFLYPANLLLFLGETMGWGLYFALHLVLAGLSTRALARRLGASDGGSLLAAIGYAGSGYLVAQVNHVPYFTAAAWTPLVVNLGLSVAAGRRRSLPWLALALALAALAGEPFTLILTLLFLLLLVLAGVSGGRRLPALVGIGVAGGIALLLASPALLPASETLGSSVRGTGYASGVGDLGSIHPLRLTTLLAPEGLGRFQIDPSLQYEVLGAVLDLPVPILLALHLGAVVLLLLFFAPFCASKPARWLAIVGIAAVVLSLGTFLGVAPLVTEHVPGMGVFRYPHKYWLLATLAATLLAGLATDRIGGKRAVVSIVAAVAAVAAVATGSLLGRPGSGLLGAVPFLLAGGAAFAPSRFRVGILTGVLAVELLVVGVRLHPTLSPERVSPEAGLGPALAADDPERLFVEFLFPPQEAGRKAVLDAPLHARCLDPLVGMPHGFSYSFGYDPTDPNWRHYAYLHSANFAPDPLRREVFHRLLRLSGNTHSVTNVDLRADPALRVVAEATEGIRAYAYVSPLPRVRLYGAALGVPDVESAQARLADLRFDAERVLLVEGEVPPALPARGGGALDIAVDAPRRVEIACRSSDPAWLFLADHHAPGWKATVNGKPATIERAFIAYRAVRVPAGESRVIFTYDPNWLSLVPFSFGIGVVLLLGLFLFVRQEKAPDCSYSGSTTSI